MNEGPWMFDKQLLMIQNFDGTKQVNQICFIEQASWIIICELPLMARNEYVGKLIGGSLGRVEKIDLASREMAWGEFMSVKVNIDITRPLVCGKKLNIGLQKPIWVRFTYDCLPDFCFTCG